MRKFTLFFIFLVIGAFAFAQQPVVTPVWDISVNGTADWSTGIPIGGEVPSWMGGTTERGMALYDGNLYVVSRKTNPPVLQVLDATNGELVNTIEIDTLVAVGGTFAVNDIAITPSGKILLANLATNTHTQPFKVYVMEENEQGGYDMSTLLSWHSQDSIDGVEQPTNRLGDGFAFYGDVTAEDDGYILVGDANSAALEPIVYRWNVQAGVVTDTVPQKIVLQEVYPAPVEPALPKLGITPRLFPISNDMFWADGHSTYPALYNMDGELLTTFNGEVAPVSTGISGVNFFTFKGNDYILTPATNHAPPAYAPAAAFELFQIPAGGAEVADSIAIFPEHGLGGNTNASYAAPLAVDVQDNQVMLYIMSPNNGVAAYKLTMAEDTTEGVWNISGSSFNALGTVDADTTIRGLTIYAHSEKTVVIDENGKTLEGMDFTHRLKLGGGGDIDENGMPLGRVLAFDVEGNATITVMAMSSSSSENRELYIAAEHPDSVFATFPALGSEISKGVYNYTGPATTIYMYSPSSGVNIYYLKVESATGITPVVERQNIRVYPNPATDKVYISVNEPTQIAIYNLSGSMVLSRLVQSESDYINVSDMQPGMYIVKSQFKNGFTQKLIVR